MSAVSFIKMHGLGNDFVVIDARNHRLDIGEAAARRIADRHTGVGCDQVIVIETAANGGADAFMRIRNSDGGEVAACGNAARCVAELLMREKGVPRLTLATRAGLLAAERGAGGAVAVDMGPARTLWQDIPLARAMDTLHLPVALGPLADPVAVSMGNPHAVFFVPDAAAIDLAALGPTLERHELFPERANIGVAQILSPGRIRLRVWERGAGLTLACGTGACAALVAASRRGLASRKAELVLDGGALAVEWREDNHVVMSGPVATSFSGAFEEALIA
jgi:diaminopimelate epimerase